MSERLTGSVVFYAPQKKFGFLRADNAERDCFFHIDNYRGSAMPGTGDRVTFLAEVDPRRSDRQRAKDIIPIN